jgi:hypothetical protein
VDYQDKDLINTYGYGNMKEEEQRCQECAFLQTSSPCGQLDLNLTGKLESNVDHGLSVEAKELKLLSTKFHLLFYERCTDTVITTSAILACSVPRKRTVL